MATKRKDTKSSEEPILPSFIIAQGGLIEKITRQAFSERRELFVHELARRMRKIAPKGKVDEQESGWQIVESLSRLRSIVGGRFEKLKARWLEAGFPLKEHRADSVGQVSVDESGWMELSSWILTQGFEAKLAPERKDCLFLIREVK